MLKATLFSILVLAPLAHPAAASDSPLEVVIRKSWSSSRLLEAQAGLETAASNDRWRRWIFNEPQLTYQNSDDNTAQSLGLQLTTAFPGKSFALTTLYSARYRTQTAELQARKYELTRTVAQSYLDCASAQEVLRLQRETSADLQTVFQSLKALYETGHSTQAEKIGAELQARQAQLDLLTAEDKSEVLCRKYRELLATIEVSDPAQDVPLPDDVSPSLVSELGKATADQSRSRASIDLAKANANTAWWSQLPDITLSATRNHYLYQPGSPSGQEWTFTYSASVTLPLLFPFHETVEAIRARNQATVDRDTAELQSVAADADQKDAALEYRRSLIRLKSLRSYDLTLAEALVESTFSSYRSGKLGYAELVLSRKTLNDLRSQDVSLRASIINAHFRCLQLCSKDSL